MEQEPNKDTFFADLWKLVVEYFQTRLEITRLSAFDKIAKIVALMFSGLILAVLGFFGLLFISFMGGFYLTQVLGSAYQGFGIIGALYLLAFWILLSNRKKWIEQRVINTVIRVLYEKQDNDEDDED